MSAFFVLISVLFMNTSFGDSSLEELRANYHKAVQDKVLCKKMINELEKSKTKSATYLAYLGGFQGIWASHVFNPIKKIQSFKEGKKNIEDAINKDSENIEIRFIRLSIQKNAPSFLGYNNDIEEDRNFIIKNKDQISSEVLKKNIQMLLK